MIRQIFIEAFSTVSHQRLRSVLTMMSVTWGVASLVLLLSYGQGFGDALGRAYDTIGKDLIVVFNGQTSLQAGGERAGQSIQLEMRDYDALVDGVPAIKSISPEVRYRMTLGAGYRSRDYTVAGVYASYESIRSMALESGRFLSEADVHERRRVVVLGATVRKALFGTVPAPNNEIKINGVRFTVAGVLKKKPQIANYYEPDDMIAFIPLTVLSELTDTRYLTDIAMVPMESAPRDRTIVDIRSALARVHNFNPRDERAVKIVDWNQFRLIVENIAIGFNVLLVVLGTLTLGIGAAGVMNIMLVSVTERTHEIGILKSIGARRRHVLTQFLLEALMITLVGGCLGFFVAGALTAIIGELPLLGPMYEDVSGTGDIKLAVSFSGIFISSIILVCVGLISGLIPATRAANMDPIEALRSD